MTMMIPVILTMMRSVLMTIRTIAMTKHGFACVTKLAWRPRAMMCRFGLACAFAGLAVVTMSLTVTVATTTPVQAQDNIITITEGSVEPTPIAIADFVNDGGNSTRLGREIARIIAADLSESGLFEVRDVAAFITPPQDLNAPIDFSEWNALGVEALLVGTAMYTEDNDIVISFSLWDVVLNRLVAAGEGTVAESGKRRIAHQVADVVYKDWTGDDGYFDTRIVYVAEADQPTNASNAWRLWTMMAITICISLMVMIWC